jgi:hypothetical protein
MQNNMTFADIFKNSFLKNAGSGFSALDVAMTIAITFALGVFIFYVYKKSFRGVLYTRGFNISLIVLALVTSLVIMAISSNIVLSLGMVGALSIVRFRTAIKDPMDIVFMFWAISVGILDGAGLYVIAISGSLFIGLVLYAMTRVSTRDRPYLLVATLTKPAAEGDLLKAVSAGVGRYIVKSKSVSSGTTELTLEFRLKGSDTDFVNEVSTIDGVGSAVLVSYNGDYVS